MKLKKPLILIAILVIPGVAYLFLQTGNNQYRRLPFIGEMDIRNHEVNGRIQVDTIYHTIPDFTFTGSDSLPVTQEQFNDKIYIADFFFTSCRTICPKMTSQMARLQMKVRDYPDVILLSHTVDPEYDTPQILAEYARVHKAIPGKWYFVTGSKKDLYDIARHGYLVNALEGDGGPDDFIHSEYFVLVDKEKRIRGMYDGTDRFAVDSLLGDVAMLRWEYGEKGRIN